MEKNLISIIIRTKNEERWISKCLKKIYKQTYKNFEIIIIDNNSDDKTIKKMKPGSVIFDMAVESGGNVEGSILDEINVINGVKVMGFSNLPSIVSDHASFALSNNFINFIFS